MVDVRQSARGQGRRPIRRRLIEKALLWIQVVNCHYAVTYRDILKTAWIRIRKEFRIPVGNDASHKPRTYGCVEGIPARQFRDGVRFGQTIENLSPKFALDDVPWIG